MKKIFNYLLVLALVAFQFLPVANAASITVNNAVVGQEYNVYKIFDVTKTGEGENSTYAYSIDGSVSNPWFAVVKSYADSTGTIKLTNVVSTTKYVVKVTELFDAADFAKHLNENKAGKPIVATKTANSDSITIDGLAAGYYFIDSSLGALCILHTTTDTLTVYEKNSIPTVEKTISQTSASVGGTVTYTVTITAGGDADTDYILHDKMTAGLTLNPNSFTVKVGNTDVAETNYDIKTGNEVKDDCTFEIVFNNNYTKKLPKDTKITVTYTATVNKNAIINSEDSNEAKVQYGNSYTPSKIVKVYNYDFDLVKINEAKEQLTGAKFKLYDAKTGGSEIELTLVTENNETFYRPLEEGDEAVEYILAGSVSIKGLEKGTYYLEEIEAPEGYNQLTERVEVKLNSDLTVERAIKVENTTGSMLPSTGGMGTTLFVLIGSMMVLSFGVLLVTKLRISKMYI